MPVGASASRIAMIMTTDGNDEDARDRVMDALCFALQMLDSQGLAKPALHVSLAIDLLDRLAAASSPPES